jgi:hypothetical protein
MVSVAEIHSDRNGNSHTVRSVLCIIMSFVMPIVNEMLFDVRFASQRYNDH